MNPNLVTVILFVLISLPGKSLVAQESSDPAAVDILEKIKKDHDKHKSHLIEFELTIEYPGEKDQVQDGRLLQAGESFALDIDNRQVISDNKTVWMYLRDRNELQITDADFGEDGEYMSPNTIFSLYDSDEFVFGLIEGKSEQGKPVREIVCKPVDPDSEYAKMSLTVAPSSIQVYQFKIFGKDGSRITMRLLNHDKNVAISTDAFTFDPSEYPDIIVEDLRF